MGLAIKRSLKMTLFVSLDLVVVSVGAFMSTILLFATAAMAKTTPETSWGLNHSVNISRGTSLIDRQDGSRSDSSEFAYMPALKTPIGGLSAKIVYSKDLRDDMSTRDEWADIPVAYSPMNVDWGWSPPYILTLSPTLTAVIPASEISIKKNNLNGSFILGVNFRIKPDGVFAADGGWSLSIGATIGRNFHTYEEDILGGVLNKHSSNQSLALGYSWGALSVSFEFLNRVRWTYQNRQTSSFVAAQELGYAISPVFSVAIGHSNEASALKPNGYESNYSLTDEKTSTVYANFGLSF
jgi:hypothetical protein